MVEYIYKEVETIKLNYKDKKVDKIKIKGFGYRGIYYDMENGKQFVMIGGVRTYIKWI